MRKELDALKQNGGELKKKWDEVRNEAWDLERKIVMLTYSIDLLISDKDFEASKQELKEKMDRDYNKALED